MKIHIDLSSLPTMGRDQNCLPLVGRNGGAVWEILLAAADRRAVIFGAPVGDTAQYGRASLGVGEDVGFYAVVIAAVGEATHPVDELALKVFASDEVVGSVVAALLSAQEIGDEATCGILVRCVRLLAERFVDASPRTQPDGAFILAETAITDSYQ